MSYPASLDGANDYLLTANNISTTIPSLLSSVATTVTVASTAGFPTSGVFSINNEVIRYTGKSGNDLTGCDRGYDGTTAVQHAAGSTVEMRWVSAHHSLVVTGLLNLQSVLGINPQGSNSTVAERLSFTLPATVTKSATTNWNTTHTRDRIVTVQLYEQTATNTYSLFTAPIQQVVNVGGTSEINITLPTAKTGYIIYN